MRAGGLLGVILPKHRDPRFVTIRRGGTLTDSDHQLLALWAASCAEHVLDRFESARPEDPRPREAIEQARAWVRGNITMSQARTAGGHAMAAARDLSGSARHAAYAAGQAAVVAHVAAHELGDLPGGERVAQVPTDRGEDDLRWPPIAREGAVGSVSEVPMTEMAGKALTAAAVETIARSGGLVAGRACGHRPTLPRAPHDFADSLPH